MSFKKILGRPVIHPVLFYANKIGVIYFFFLFLSNFFPILGLSDLFFFAFKSILFLLLFLSFFQLREKSPLNFLLLFDPSPLKTRGMFAFSRNPLYTLINIVIIITLKNYWSNFLVLGIAAYVIITHHFIILKEEEYLLEKWGEQYREYKKQVKRYGFF